MRLSLGMRLPECGRSDIPSISIGIIVEAQDHLPAPGGLPNEFDLLLVKMIENLKIPYWFPTDRLYECQETHRNNPIRIIHFHHFYTNRNLFLLSDLRNKVNINKVRQ